MLFLKRITFEMSLITSTNNKFVNEARKNFSTQIINIFSLPFNNLIKFSPCQGCCN